MPAMTLTEKILARHAGKPAVGPGDNVWVDVDVLMTHDVCGPGTIGIFKQHFGKDAKVWDRDKVVIIPDHYIFTAAGWLAVTGYADPYRPSFTHGVSKGWKERFRLTRALTEVWLGRPMPDVGGHRDGVAEARKHIAEQVRRARPPADGRPSCRNARPSRPPPSGTRWDAEPPAARTRPRHPVGIMLFQRQRRPRQPEEDLTHDSRHRLSAGPRAAGAVATFAGRRPKR